MNLNSTLSLNMAEIRDKCKACTVPVIGFKKPDENRIREILHQIPNKFMSGFTKICNEHLTPKHGRFVSGGPIILFDERSLVDGTKFGSGPDKMDHGEMTLVHEVGHSVFENLSKDKQNEWKKLSGWKNGSGPGQAVPYTEKRSGWSPETSTETHKKGAKFPREYSRKNWMEDFADCFSWWVNGHGDLLDPQKLIFLKSL